MRERIKQVLGSVFDIPVDQVPDDASVDGLSQWDSLRHLELMLALESAFSLRISTDTMLELLSLQNIEAFVETGRISTSE